MYCVCAYTLLCTDISPPARTPVEFSHNVREVLSNYYCNACTVFMLIEHKLNIIAILNFAQFSGKGRHALH